MLLAADSPDLSTSPDCGLAFFFTSRAPPPGAQLSPLYSPLSRVAASPHPCSLCSVVVALFTALPALLTRPHHPPQRRAQTLPKCVFDLAAGARARELPYYCICFAGFALSLSRACSHTVMTHGFLILVFPPPARLMFFLMWPFISIWRVHNHAG